MGFLSRVCKNRATINNNLNCYLQIPSARLLSIKNIKFYNPLKSIDNIQYLPYNHSTYSTACGVPLYQRYSVPLYRRKFTPLIIHTATYQVSNPFLTSNINLTKQFHKTTSSFFTMRIIRTQTNQTISDAQVLDKLTDSIIEFHRNLREILCPLVDLKDPFSTRNFLNQIIGTAAAEDLSHLLSFRFAYFIVFAIQICPNLCETILSIHENQSNPNDTSSNSLLVHYDLNDTLDSLCNSVLLFQQQIRDIITPVFNLLDATSTARFVERVQHTPAAADLAYVISWRFAYFIRLTTMICPTIEGLCRRKFEDKKEEKQNVSKIVSTSFTKLLEKSEIKSQGTTDEKDEEKKENGSETCFSLVHTSSTRKDSNGNIE